MQVGKYQLVTKLATGGMAEVFLAKSAGPMGFEKTLVLKRILPHMAEDPSFVDMFLGEAKLAAQLNHPNIVQIFDFGEAAGSHYLAMEYIDGPNLRALAKRVRASGAQMPPALSAKIISYACEGLGFAHAFADPTTGEPLGLIHRDISPDNIMVSRQGAVKVVDFGIAKAAGQANRTQTGVVKGKLSYMPPEQLQTKGLDLRVDVYALGVVLYEMLTGFKPFNATTDVSIMQAILFEPLIPVGERRSDLPPALQGILERALAKDRDQRYPDCHAFQADLERFIMSTGEPVGAYQIAQFIKQYAGDAGGPVATPASGSRGAASASGARPSMAPPPPVEPPPAPVPTEMSASRYLAGGPPLPPPAPPEAPEVLEPLTAATWPGGLPPSEVPARPQPAAPAFEAALARGAEKSAEVRPTKVERTGTALELRPDELAAVRGKPRWLVPVLGGMALLAAGGAFVALRPQPLPAPVAAAPVTPPPAAAPTAVATAPAPVPEAPPAVAEAPSAPVAESPAGTAEAAPAAGTGETAPAIDAAPVAAAPTVGTAVAGAAVAPATEDKGAVAPAPSTPEPVVPEESKPAAVAVRPTSSSKRQRPTTVKRTGEAGGATVEFRIRPYATVILDGKNIGQTPFAAIQVPAGRHTVKLINRDLDKEVTRSLVVTSGKPVIFKHNLLEE